MSPGLPRIRINKQLSAVKVRRKPTWPPSRLRGSKDAPAGPSSSCPACNIWSYGLHSGASGACMRATTAPPARQGRKHGALLSVLAQGGQTVPRCLIALVCVMQDNEFAVSPSTPLLSTAIDENGWVCGATLC